jgi:hypothetical protein
MFSAGHTKLSVEQGENRGNDQFIKSKKVTPGALEAIWKIGRVPLNFVRLQYR